MTGPDRRHDRRPPFPSSSIPVDVGYTSDHEWVRIDGDIATFGITPYAAEALGDIVYLELPGVGATVVAGTVCGEVESTKSVSDLFAPVSGEVTDRNEDSVTDPSVVNSDPFSEGWLVRVRMTDSPSLLDAAHYATLIGNER